MCVCVCVCKCYELCSESAETALVKVKRGYMECGVRCKRLMLIQLAVGSGTECSFCSTFREDVELGMRVSGKKSDLRNRRGR